MPIKKFTIYGERCSGTNFLENAIKTNYNLEVTWEYEWKHFWGFQDLASQDKSEVLFIGIAKSFRDWVHSFLHLPHHIPARLKHQKNYWEKPIFSEDAKGKLIPTDLHIHEKRPYKNLFEMRRVKHACLLHDIPKQVDNFIFTNYTNLNEHYKKTLLQIEKRFGLTPLRKGPTLNPVTTYKGVGKRKLASQTKSKPRIIPDTKLRHTMCTSTALTHCARKSIHIWSGRVQKNNIDLIKLFNRGARSRHTRRNRGRFVVGLGCVHISVTTGRATR